jgi:hypothetical protein
MAIKFDHDDGNISRPIREFELRKKIEKTTQNDQLLNDHAIAIIKSKFPKLNDDQLKAIQIVDGPLQIVAAPGSGKTLVLVLRTLYLLLSGKAEPHQIMLTTLHQYAMLCGYCGPLYEIKLGQSTQFVITSLDNTLVMYLYSKRTHAFIE